MHALRSADAYDCGRAPPPRSVTMVFAVGADTWAGAVAVVKEQRLVP